jgi:hypothetical protein
VESLVTLVTIVNYHLTYVTVYQSPLVQQVLGTFQVSSSNYFSSFYSMSSPVQVLLRVRLLATAGLTHYGDLAISHYLGSKTSLYDPNGVGNKRATKLSTMGYFIGNP